MSRLVTVRSAVPVAVPAAGRSVWSPFRSPEPVRESVEVGWVSPTRIACWLSSCSANNVAPCVLVAEPKKDKAEPSNGHGGGAGDCASTSAPGGGDATSSGAAGAGASSGQAGAAKPERPSSLGTPLPGLAGPGPVPGPGRLTRRLLCYHSEHPPTPSPTGPTGTTAPPPAAPARPHSMHASSAGKSFGTV